MKIRQEVWTPSTHWKTALSHGDLSQSGVVFCFGNPGKQNAQAIFNEVKHSFPGADLVFGFLDESHEEKLFLTAFQCDQTTYVFDQVNLSNLSEDTKEITNRFEEKKWKEVMIGLDADTNYTKQMVNNLEKTLADNFSEMNRQQPSHRIRLGLNSMPEHNRAISLAITGDEFSISLKRKESQSSKSSVATQSMWDRYAGSIKAGEKVYTFYFPIALLSA